VDRLHQLVGVRGPDRAGLDRLAVLLLPLPQPGQAEGTVAPQADEVQLLAPVGRWHVSPDGKVKIDPTKLTARRDIQVKPILDKSAFGLIVLGGSNDLSDSVRRAAAGQGPVPVPSGHDQTFQRVSLSKRDNRAG
jgi:hypothetical protein